MVAGLPGFGLSGVFFVVSALLMLPLEVVATLRGRSSLARWGAVLTGAGIALTILAGLELTYAALQFAATHLFGTATSAHHGHSAARAAGGVGAIPVLPFLGTLGLVAIVIICGKAAELLSDLRRTPVQPRPEPQREVADSPQPLRELLNRRSLVEAGPQ